MISTDTVFDHLLKSRLEKDTSQSDKERSSHEAIYDSQRFPGMSQWWDISISDSRHSHRSEIESIKKFPSFYDMKEKCPYDDDNKDDNSKKEDSIFTHKFIEEFSTSTEHHRYDKDIKRQ